MEDDVLKLKEVVSVTFDTTPFFISIISLQDQNLESLTNQMVRQCFLRCELFRREEIFPRR